MNIKNIISRISLDNLLNDLGLENTTEEFKQNFTTTLEEKYYKLVEMKLFDKLGEEKFNQLLDKTSENLDQFLEENIISLPDIMQEVADFLRVHLEDYKDGIEDFIENANK